MSDNIFILEESSSDESETSSEGEEINILTPNNEMIFNEHTHYRNDTIKILPVVIDVNRIDMTGDINFYKPFDEPIIIHKLCDIYLDNLVTYNCKKNSGDISGINMGFLLDIKELDITTISSSDNMKNKSVIPNGHFMGENLVTTHRSKKMNYISTIQPKIINSFTGSITILDGTTNIWHPTNTTNGRFTMELNFIFR
jgi:hypothetical protein